MSESEKDKKAKDFEEFERFWESLNIDDDSKIFTTLVIGGSVSTTSEHHTSMVSNISLEVSATTIANRVYNIDSGFFRWSIGINKIKAENKNADEIVSKTLELYFEHLDGEHGVDDWMQLCCVMPLGTSSIHHDLFHDLFTKSEEKLFGDKTGISLLSPYSANTGVQVGFNLVRSYFRAEEGDFEAAKIILDQLDASDLATQYRVDVLFLRFLTLFSTGEWEKAINDVHKIWAIIKLTDAKQRYDLGCWDTWFTVNLLLWLFGRYSEEFRALLVPNLFARADSLFQFRKVTLLSFLKPKDIVNLMSPVYYERLRQELPNLPEVPIDDTSEESSTEE
jgi:hypothetical protein